jgi:ribonuclease R
MARKRAPRPLPSRAELLDFIATSPTPVGKREIARAFRVGAADRVALKGLLKDIERGGEAERGPKRRLQPPGALPEICVLEITGIDDDGELFAKPLVALRGEPPMIRVLPGPEGGAAGVGERVAARLTRIDARHYEARVIRALGKGTERILGIFRSTGDGGIIEPTDRKAKDSYLVLLADARGAGDGELVFAEALPSRRLGMKRAKITDRLGDMADPRSISLVAIHTQGIPVEFPPEAIAEAEAAMPVELGTREDLRDLPLVTIDGADARDFDDAVFAARDGELWHLVVAIADVAWYVRPDSALDRAARERGNSVYFPDRVVPMLPEALSNDLCSLRPHENRACLAMHMWLDENGQIRRYRFSRALMRSAARLTYEEAQAAIDGRPSKKTRELLEPVVKPLFAAWRLLDRARGKRRTLELDLPERKVVIGKDGRVEKIEPRARLDSHRLIEEFMIAANVAAAETLERMRQACMYRIHDAPAAAKLAALADFLEGIGIPGLKLSKGQVPKPRHFNQILAKVQGTPFQQVVHELVLRSQAQAVYSPENIGHFGLALRKYAHFTSPIRRYADLLVHRALLMELPAMEPKEFAALGEHISTTERRAAAAERDALNRYVVAYLADRAGARFRGRINGVQRFGVFVTLDETGADGLVPMKHLPEDYYVLEEKQQRLIGRRWGRTFTMGDAVEVVLVEADTTTGSLVFELVAGGGEGEGAPAAAPRGRGRKSGRGKKEGEPPRRGRRGR